MYKITALFCFAVFFSGCGGAFGPQSSGGGSIAVGVGGASVPISPGKGSAGEVLYVSRQEMLDQGSGMSSDGNYVMSKTTMGGNYLRQFGTSSSNYILNPGLHGNPVATK